ncbi:MAG: zinc ABC transporter substrate-binding protein, partial [Actinomycetota bacterium]|nr:zinc ABC transporter substrate-binding protein [Actinomycetota bacterium]
MISRRIAVLLLPVVALPACGGGDGEAARTAGGRAKLQVVTTVAPITSITANVAGGLADITGVVPEGTNSHTFEPAPSVAEVLSKADLIFLNGLGLEEPTKRMAEENRTSGGKIVDLGTEVLPEAE